MPVPDLEKLNASARPAWLWDPQLRRVVWANPAAAAFFGESSLLDLVERPFDAREPAVEAIARALAEGGAEAVELLFPSATDAPLAASVRPHALPDGRTGAFVMALHALPGEDAPPALLREVLSAMPLAVAVCDHSARLVYANPAAIEMFGEEALDALSGLFDSVSEARAFLARAARAGTAAITRPASTRAGRRDVRITARRMDDDGLLALVMEDVTPRRMLAGSMETLPFPAAAEAPSPRPPRMPLSEEDVQTFHRLSGQELPRAEEGRAGKPPREEAAGADAAPSISRPSPDSAGEEAEAPRERKEPEDRPRQAPAPEAPGKEEQGRDAPEPSTPERKPVVVIGAPGAGREAAADAGGPSGEPKEHDAKEAGEKKDDAAPQKPPAVEDAPSSTRDSTRASTPCEARQAAAGRPETPQLVREVLDQRKEPIILQRAERFYYANEAARALFAAPLEAPVWDGIAARLAAAADGAVVRLPDDAGAPFRLRRDVFPWRDGAVVQSTLIPEKEGKGTPTGERGAATAPSGRSPSSSEATTPPAPEAGKKARAQENVPPARAKRAGPVSISIRPQGAGQEALSSRTGEDEGKDAPRPPAEASAGLREAPKTPAPEAAAPAATAPAPAPPCQPEPIDDELRAILDTATDGIITLNKAGEILSFSAGAEALFGLPLKEAVGRPFRELLEPESRRILRDYLDVLETGGELAAIYDEGREVTARVAGGGTIPLFLTIGRLGRRGEPERPNKAAYCIVVRDITQWKKTERELRAAKERAERSSAQKSEFLAAISHELRTPLNAILGFSDVMRQQRFGEMGNEKYLVYANDIHESGEHLLSLINDLLDLSKIEAGKMEMHFEAVDIAAIATESLNLMEEQASRAQVLLRRSIPADLPKVVADARAMKQIFLNLLSNAVKFTPSGGQVMLALKLNGAGELVATISDTGPGMTEEELAQAMKPFRRLSGKGREDKPGTGLGLPLTRALAEANKARFELKSAPGKGVVARIVFPTPRVLVG